MTSAALGRTWLSLPAAVVLSLLLTGQSLAATWSDPVRVAKWAWAPALATLGGGTALTAYERCSADVYCSQSSIYIQRSTDAGATWSMPVFRAYGYMGDIAGRGTDVDVVWRGLGGALRYAHSADSGASFAKPIGLSGGERTDGPAVARGPRGVVAVTWGDYPGDAQPWRYHVRVSTDGGWSFAPEKSWPADEGLSGIWVAAGDGVLYVSHLDVEGSLVVRRSIDDGATWSTVRFSDRSEWLSIVASGARAYVAYETLSQDGQSHILMRSTSDRGAHWSSSTEVAPSRWSSGYPAMALDGGTLRLIFTKRLRAANCSYPGRIFYRESPDGSTWTPPEPVTPRFCHSEGSDVGFAGHPLVVWDIGAVFSASR